MNKTRLAAKFELAMGEKRLLPAPKDLPKVVKAAESAVPLSKMVEDFITGPVKDAILATDMTYDNKKNVLTGRTSTKDLPKDHYRVAKDFNPLFEERMLAEGYTASISHDGGGMYSVAYITWTVDLNEGEK